MSPREVLRLMAFGYWGIWHKIHAGDEHELQWKLGSLPFQAAGIYREPTEQQAPLNDLQLSTSQAERWLKFNDISQLVDIQWSCCHLPFKENKEVGNVEKKKEYF